MSLIIERTVGPLVAEKMTAFRERAQALSSDRRRLDVRIAELRAIDPAEEILKLKIVDPAMGSGHFLVSLVDYLAEQVVTAIGDAHEAVAWTDYVSPLVGRLATIWAKIRTEADAHGWSMADEQLSDKNLVKRFVLKRCVYGVDEEPDGGRTRQGFALAAHLYGWRAAVVPRSSSRLWQFPVRRMGAQGTR